MEIRQLLEKCRRKGIEFDIFNDKLKINAKKGVLTKEILNEIKENKQGIIDFIQLYKNDAEETTLIQKTVEDINYDLSPGQKRMWILAQLEQELSPYTLSSVFKIKGALDLEILHKSFLDLIDRHESLRTVFKEDEKGEIKQWILTKEEIGFNIKSIDSVPDDTDEIDRIIEKESNKIYELDKGPLFNVVLLKIENGTYFFVFLMHHIIGDGWSMNVLVNDLLHYYNNYIDSEAQNYPDLKIQYKDYASWLNNQLEDGLNKDKNYWLEQFSGELPVLDLASDRKRPAVQTFNGGEVIGTIKKDNLSKLNQLLNETGSTLFVGLLSLINVLLYKYSGQKDIIIGSPIAGRNQTELENQIGFYLNILPFRVQFDDDMSFMKLMGRVKEITYDGYGHQLYPYDRLLMDLGVTGVVDRNPLFDVLLTLQNFEDINLSEKFKNLSLEHYDRIERKTSKVDLTFIFSETQDDLKYCINYNSDLFDKISIERISKHLQQLLLGILADPHKDIKKLKYLSQEEENQILYDFNDTQQEYPQEKSIVNYFKEEVNKSPDKIALVFEDTEMSYKKLDELSDKMAHQIIKDYSISLGDRVGIQLERSEMMIVSILAILKSGGCYVPIDNEYPAKRKEYITNDSGIKLLIIDNSSQLDLTYYQGAIFDINSEIKEEYSINELKIVDTDAAYIMYTSGSTGAPKGAVIEHKSVIRLVKENNYCNVDSSDLILSTGSPSFDATTFEYWGALLNGATLIIARNETFTDAEILMDLIQHKGVTKMWFTSGLLNNLIDSNIKIFSSLKTVLAGGDKLSVSHVNSLLKENPELKIINGYGPTENTTFSTTYLIENIQERNIPIGKPITNSQVYILKDKELQGIGVIGEICVGGSGLSRGYINKPELTKEKFIPNPFNESGYLYRTGDLGKWLPDGNIEFIGRIDKQVKIRGYRIELGEIEKSLIQCNNVENCIVKIDDKENDKSIVAYITGNENLEISNLRNELNLKLPNYMIPQYFILLQEFPLTPNGKIDMNILPAPRSTDIQRNIEYIAPTTEIEKELARIWSEILELEEEKISLTDNFFQIGGHSLKATRLISQISKKLGKKISLKQVFSFPLLSEQASLLKDSDNLSHSKITPTPILKNYALSSSQNRLWILDQIEEGNGVYNIPMVINLDGNYDIHNFTKAINATIDRHEILRTVFKEDDKGNARQWILNRSELNFEIKFHDLRKESLAENFVEKYIKDDSLNNFDIANGPLIRATLFRMDEQSYVFYYNMHHIISDGWSMNVLAEDVLAFHDGYKLDGNFNLKPLKVQYKDYAAWQLENLKNTTSGIDRKYWMELLEGELPLFDLLNTRKRPLYKNNKGNCLETILNENLSRKLKTLCIDNGGSLFMGLLASIKILFFRYTAENDIIIGTPTAGRNHSDLDRQIGFYVNTLALRNQISGDENFLEFFDKIKSSTLEAYTHQDYPFDQLVAELDPRRDPSRSAIFDVMLNLHHSNSKSDSEEIAGIQSGIITAKGNKPSKFDLSITFEEVGDRILFNIIHNVDVYLNNEIKSFMEHYVNILSDILNYPEKKISKLNFLNESEKTLLTTKYNSQNLTYEREKTIIDYFEKQVEKKPDEIALVYDDVKIDYKTLNEKSNQLANYLKENYRIGKEDLVAICLGRSERMIISILGILKTGATYVPIDIEFPNKRIKYILNDIQSKVCIDENEFNQFENHQFNYDKENLKEIISPKNLAYIIYTSGSTGKPKGVMIEHLALMDYTFGIIDKTEITDCKTFGLVSTIAADLGNTVIFPSLVTGGELHIFTEKEIKNSLLISNKKIDCIKIVPSHWKSLQGDDITFIPTKCLIFGGEQLSIDLIKDINSYQYSGNVYNHYGPTETTIGKLASKINHTSPEPEISLGSVIGNNDVYILDKKLELLPIGAIGEICIGGDGLARGYLNLDELTKEKFVTNPYKRDEKMYLTGDLGRRLPNGNIVFIGRKDDQVKIRGFRIELGEIKKALIEHEAIEQAVVMPLEDGTGDKRLVAYIVSKDELDTTELKDFLIGLLPNYMVPNHFVRLDKLPLNKNGKIERRELPSLEDFAIKKGEEIVAPRNKTEEQLIEIWKEILGSENIGINDSFFDLGGHSLKAIGLMRKYHKHFDVQLEVKEIFKNPTIQKQAKLILQSSKSLYERINKIDENVDYSVSSAQKRLWIMSQVDAVSIVYNVPGRMNLGKRNSINTLKRTIYEIIDKYEITRTTFHENEEGEVRQKIWDRLQLDFNIPVENLIEEKYPISLIEKYQEKQKIEPFDLGNGPLLKVRIFTLPDGTLELCFNMHHIISDARSMTILYENVLNIYDKIEEGTLHEIEKLPIQYKDYTVWQNQNIKEGENNLSKEFWISKLQDAVKIDLPTKLKRPVFKSYNGKGIGLDFSKELSLKLASFAKENNTSLFIVLITAMKSLYYLHTEQKNLVIGTSVDGRNHADLADQIGFFINAIALPSPIDEKKGFRVNILDTSKETLGAYEHQNYPYDQLVDELNLKRDFSRNPFFDVMLTYRDRGEGTATETERIITGELEDLGEMVAKLDLSLFFVKESGFLTLTMIYNTDVYEQGIVELFIKRFELFLENALNNPELPIESLNYSNENESQTALYTDLHKEEQLYLERIFDGDISSMKIHLLGKDNKPKAKACYGDVFIEYKNWPVTDIPNNRVFSSSTNERLLEDNHLMEIKQKGYKDIDGKIRFLGRADQIVQLNGVTVFLREIENIMNSIEGIQEAAIFQDPHQKEKLQAFIVEEKEISDEEIIRLLKEYFPNYQIPTSIIRLETIPKLLDGTYDRNSLVDFNVIPESENLEHISPSTDLEKEIASIFKELLEIDKVSIEDNFFEIGGNSIKAAMVLARIHKEYGVRIDVVKIFSNPTIKFFAKEIESLKKLGGIKPDSDSKIVKKVII